MPRYSPEKDMTILVKSSNGNIFGMISKITENKIVLTRLDDYGSLIIDMESNWEPIDVLDPKSLKHYYDNFIGKDVVNIFVSHFNDYKLSCKNLKK